MQFSIRLIDRYVFLLFARVFLTSFLCLTGIYVVGDFVNNLAEFIEIGKARGGMFPAMLSYYGARTPLFFDSMGRVVSLVSAVFAITWMQRHNEMTALMAAGISRWRIIRPLVIGVVGVAVLAAINRELVLPRLGDTLSQRAQDLVSEKGQSLRAQYDRLTSILIDGKEAFPKKQMIGEPKFQMPSSLSAFGVFIAAEQAIYRSENEQHPAGFLMMNVTEPLDISGIDSVVGDQPLVMTSKDYKWLKPNQCFIASNVSLKQLSGNPAWRQYASTPSLVAALNNPSLNLGSDVPMTIHGRVMQPIVDVLLFFLGVPVVLSRESRNVFVSVGSCLLVVVAFFVILTASQALGMAYIVTPALAAWLPVLVLMPWAILVSEPLRR
ncbi:LptF/LptG family permease [Planctomycetota bacterium]